LTTKKFKHSPLAFGLSESDYKEIFQVGNQTLLTKNDDVYQLAIKSQTTTAAKVEESVQDIKEYAP